MRHYAVNEDHAPHALPFYLAMEEWLAERVDAEGAFFTWIVGPTVICGRNQDVEAEVDMGYCARHGIDVYRRKSGGGCVYADRGNMMLSYVTRRPGPIADIFADYARRVAAALGTLGYAAEVSGRNDITIGGRKVSGNAYYRTPSGAGIVHGTLLHSPRLEWMSGALTPSRAKLEAKGVKSVEARVTTLAEHSPLPLEDVRRGLIAALTDGEATLSAADTAAIERLARPYDDREWLLRRRHGMTLRRNTRRDGVGGIELALRLSADRRIIDADLTGDFFVTGDIDSEIITPLLGVKHERRAVEAALAGARPSEAVAGLTKHDLINLIC